jgi:hypothetical protein
MVLAMIGLLLSVAAHLASIVGLPIPGGNIVWSLHIGIFVVWLPAVLVGSRINHGRPRKELWKNVLSGCPAWMRYAGYALFAYAVANFIWFIVTTRSGTSAQGDPPLSEIRGFSGHWMVFYGTAFAILLSAYRNPRLLRKQRCSKGHDVSSTDVFCPSCGSKVQLDR